MFATAVCFLQLPGVKEGVGQTSTDRDATAENLRQRKDLAFREKEKGGKDHNALQSISNGSTHRTQGAQNDVLHLIVDVETEATKEQAAQKFVLSVRRQGHKVNLHRKWVLRFISIGKL